MPDQLNPAWVRLGDMLVRQRIELDPRYRNRRTFVAERAAPRLYRIVNDIERGRRDNYEPGTKAALEAAYDLEPGAIDRVVAGGEFRLPSPPALHLVPAPAGTPVTFPNPAGDGDTTLVLYGEQELGIWENAAVPAAERVNDIMNLRNTLRKYMPRHSASTGLTAVNLIP